MPIISAENLDETIAFFVLGLGFTLAGKWTSDGENPEFAIVQMDNITAGIAVVDGVNSSNHWAAYFFLDDIEAFKTRLETSGVEILRGIEDSFYKCREIEVSDPNGNRLCFAQDLEPGPNGPGL